MIDDYVFTEGETITQVLRRPKVYDEKKLWEKFHSLGKAASYDKLSEWAASQGMVHPKSKDGKPSKMGPYFAMWRYALRYPEKAYPAYEAWAKESESELIARGIEINFENFIKDIHEHALSGSVVSKSAFLEFCKKYNLDPSGFKGR